MKKALKLVLILVICLMQIFIAELNATAIGSDYWYLPTNEFEEIQLTSNGNIRFNQSDRYIYSWLRGQEICFESFLTPEELKILKSSNYSPVDYPTIEKKTAEASKAILDSVYDKLRLNDNSSSVEKLYRIYSYVFYSTQYNLEICCFPDWFKFYYYNGVCQDFAESISLLCEKAGINCYVVGSNSLNHAWNETTLNGKIYVIDDTFGDDGFLITPKEFNKLWGGSYYISSKGSYKTDSTSYKSNYAISGLNFSSYLKQTGSFWKGKNAICDIIAKPVCNGYLISWNADRKADYYLVRRRILKGKKEVSNELVKYVVPDQQEVCEFVDQSPASYSDYTYQYEVIKERLDCVTDTFGTDKYTATDGKYTGSNHLWVMLKTVREASLTSLGAQIYKCSLCHSKMMTYTSLTSCVKHDNIPVLETSASCTGQGAYDMICAKCSTVNKHLIIPASGHDYSPIVITPTAVNIGHTEYHCKRCDDVKKDNRGKTVTDDCTAPTGKLTLKCKARTAAAQTVYYNQVANATGYQVQCSDGSTRWAQTKTGAKTSVTFKGLKAGTKYKFRVRFYIKGADGKNYYSPWSNTLSSPTLPKGTTAKATVAKKAFTAKWTKVAGVTGYQVQYSTYAKFSKAVTKTVKGASKYSLAVKSLKGGAKYYVRIRTYKTVGGKNYFSDWSAAKAVTTKK